MSSIEPFSFDTIQDFDDHIARSIPNYHLLSSAICDLATFFVRPETHVVDIGCSTGALLENIPFGGHKLGIDISSNLLPQTQNGSKLNFANIDIRSYERLPNSSLIMSIFTLQFLPIQDRLGVLKLVYDSLIEGGAFIMAEKVYESDGLYEKLMTNAYYDFKRKTFSTEEIMNKERDLRSIMTVQTSVDNYLMVEEAGFRRGACFWKFYNFEAWVFVK